MKKCPTCEKTFEDNMKFCQSDGTPLEKVQETPAEPEDPYKTTVAKADDLPIPPKPEPPAPDPFQTMVAGSVEEVEEKKEPEEEKKEDFDPMQTIVSAEPPVFEKPEPKPAPPVKESVPETKDEFAPPPSPFNQKSSEPEAKTPERRKDDKISPAPEPPKFSEPDLSPPNLSEASGKLSEPARDEGSGFPSSPKETDKPDFRSSEPLETKDEEITDSVAPPTSENVAPPTSDGSDFKQKNSSPIPSPFDASMPPSYQKPSAPMPPYVKEEIKAEALNTPFAEEVKENQQIEQSGWTPPSMADSQNPGVGQANPSFQNVSGEVDGENKKLAIISLVLGILSTLCGFAFLTGIPAIIAGYMAKNKISESPSEYGGGTMATIGMILGVIGTLIVTAAYVIVAFLSFS